MRASNVSTGILTNQMNKQIFGYLAGYVNELTEKDSEMKQIHQLLSWVILKVQEVPIIDDICGF